MKKLLSLDIFKNSNKIALCLFWSILLISFSLFLLQFPSSLKPSINSDTKTEIAGTVTPENNFTTSFTTEDDNLRRIFLYFTTNIKSQPKNSPSLIISIYDSQGNMLYSDSKKMAYIKSKSFHPINVENYLKNTKNKEYKLALSLEDTLSTDSRVDLWKYPDGNLIAYFEHSPSWLQIIKKNLGVFLPSLAMIFLVIFFIFQKISSRNVIIAERRSFFVLFVVPFLFLNALFYVFWVNHMAPIDEQSHFDVIKTIAKNFKLPTLYSHDGIKATREAFQPPLYYMVSAPLIYISEKADIQAAVIRIWDVLQYLALVLVSFFIYRKLEKYFLFLKNDFAALFFFIFIGLMPSLIVRTVSISNGTFSYLMIGLQILFLLKYLEIRSHKSIIVLSVISGLSLLSRFTNIYTIPVLIIAIILGNKEGVKHLAIFLVTVTMMLSPWFLWNYNHYNALTPNQAAIENQKKIINPNGKIFGFDFIKNNSLYMFDTVPVAEEYGLSADSFSFKIARGISVLMITSLLISIFMLLKNIRQIFIPLKKEFILAIFVSLMLVNIIQQYAIVLLSNWPVLLGRYLHGSLFAISFLIVFTVSSSFRREQIQSVVFGIFSLLLILLNINYLIEVILKFN